jgi:hypothetical protein
MDGDGFYANLRSISVICANNLHKKPALPRHFATDLKFSDRLLGA